MDKPAIDPPRADELRSTLLASPWLLKILEHVGVVDPPDGWVGAGVIRDVVWDARFGRRVGRSTVKDVDVVFFDRDDLSPAPENRLNARLRRRYRNVVWDAKNQAAVHTWYPKRFGIDVPALESVPEAVATWPEYAVCVAVRRPAAGGLNVCAPHGLDDLLDGVWRRNPARVTVEEYLRRLERKQPTSRWSGVRVIR